MAATFLPGAEDRAHLVDVGVPRCVHHAIRIAGEDLVDVVGGRDPDVGRAAELAGVASALLRGVHEDPGQLELGVDEDRTKRFAADRAGRPLMGMAFTDTLLSESDATIAIVDRHHRPGGHWNDAYPFVRLHQPSSFYGVNSRKLGSDTIDATGWNRGLYELATGSEVCAYFDQVMQQQFLPSGRVQFFPMCEYQGGRRFRSRVADNTWEVACEKIVDATYMNVRVPSVTAPGYDVADGVACAPLNELPRIASDYERYVVVGAGKTGMDACLFLLAHGVDPDAISWIMPRDSWLLDRAHLQPRGAETLGIEHYFGRQVVEIAAAESLDDMFARLDASGMLLRLDPDVTPTMYRCATVTTLELEELRRIRDVVRLGRVKRIEERKIELEQGEIPTNPQTLHVDCSADGLETRPPTPVFAGEQITLQAVRVCQQVFSAALIGHVESAYDDEGTKNELCSPLPHPDTALDFVRTTLQNGAAQARWSRDPELLAWLHGSRLDGFSGDGSRAPEGKEAVGQMKAALEAAGKLQKFLAEASAE